MTEDEIRNGFWYHQMEKNFQPESISTPDEYDGSPNLNVNCTQLSISSYQQRKLVDRWCSYLPTLDSVRFLWFSSKVNQKMFNAACENEHLTGLSMDWSSVQDLSGLANLRNLKFLNIGSSASVVSIEVFSAMKQLIVLEIENFKQIRDLTPIRSLSNLEGLGVEGSTWTTQIVDSLEPICDLEKLRYLFLANLRTLDKTLKPVTRIKTLVNIRTSYWWPKSEFTLLRNSLPNLKYGSPFETELIERFGT